MLAGLMGMKKGTFPPRKQGLIRRFLRGNDDVMMVNGPLTTIVP